MSLAYRAVAWNRQKRLYDVVLGGALLLGLTVYSAAIWIFQPGTTPETFVIRFTSVAAFVLLHVILVIGPLARLDSRFLPLLYNRRHLGVTMFFLALTHGAIAVFQFHAGGNANPLVSLLSAYRRDYLPGSAVHFPFEGFGLVALGIFFLMAATSHDFWLKHLGPPIWKGLHMLVYVAYGLVIVHVLLGALQPERSPIFPLIIGIGFFIVAGLHVAAFAKEFAFDRRRAAAVREGFVRAARTEELVADQGKVVLLGGLRVALFLREGRVFALSNVCRHQGGPLGEGRIIGGCLTCPWHGYQYRVEDGCSPPPFTEMVPTREVRIIDGDIYISETSLPLGYKSAGAPAATERPAGLRSFYIGWQSKAPPELARFVRGFCLVLGVAIPLCLFLLAKFQNPVDAGIFEFGVQQTFTGTLFESPLPLLQVDGGGDVAGANFLLVGAGKFGPPDIIKGRDGHRVRFTGSLISRNGVPMIEMNRPASLEVLDSAGPVLPTVHSLGMGTYRGELVDTKCFFGVMRPATGKVHRACAIRCLSGGVPPGLLVRDQMGNAVVLLLVGTRGRTLDIDVQLAARVLEVKGELELHNGTPVLRVESWKIGD